MIHRPTPIALYSRSNATDSVGRTVRSLLPWGAFLTTVPVTVLQDNIIHVSEPLMSRREARDTGDFFLYHIDRLQVSTANPPPAPRKPRTHAQRKKSRAPSNIARALDYSVLAPVGMGLDPRLTMSIQFTLELPNEGRARSATRRTPRV